MTGSPPEDPSQFRGKTLTPVSPKPVHYPSPSNIPILEAQMEPNFNESPAVMAYSTSSSIHPPDSNPNRDTVEAQHQHQSQQAQQHQQFSQAYSAHTGANNDGQSLAADAAGRESSASSSMQYNLGNNGARTMQDILYGLQGISSSDTATGSNPNGSSGELFQSLLDTLSPPAGATTANAHSRAALNQPPSAQSNYVPQRVSAEPSAPDGANGNPNSFTEGHNLPPRPPPQEKPATHPNYAPGDDIRSYHPHSQKNPSASYRAQAGGQPAASSGQAGLPALLTQAAGSGMPLPPGSSFSQPHSATGTVSPSPATPASAYRQRDSVYERNFNAAMEPMRELKKSNDPDDAPWGPEVQKLYDQFLSDERSYVTEGQWDKFPANSRLFVGNLPSEKVTKRDLFHIFFRHGRLAQISIKQAYGFIQYLDAESCLKALRAEEGRTVRGRRMHLEISKPQQSTRKGGGGGDAGSGRAGGGRRRSRSPDYGRGGNQAPRGVDRYTSSNGVSPRERDFPRGGRARDDYRPGRSPSPPSRHRGNRGGRNRGRDRSADRYDGRGVWEGRRRSRSRSPYGRSRYRSPSPRGGWDPRDREYDREMREDEELPLPRRAPNEVPDVQIIVLDALDRGFLKYIEDHFSGRGVRQDVLLLSPRLSEAAVIRRQVIEGVTAVSRLTIRNQQSGRIPLRVFDRTAGNDNVRFEEYDELEPTVAAELVLRAKATASPATTVQPNAAVVAGQIGYGLPPPAPQYGMPPPNQYGMAPPSAAAAAAAAVAAAAPANAQQQNLSNLISSLDGQGLQKLLSTMQAAPPQQQQQQQYAQQQPPHQQQGQLPPDFSRLLAGPGAAPQHQSQPQHSPTQQQQNPYAAFAQQNPALAGLFGGGGAGAGQQGGQMQGQPAAQHHQQHQQPQPDVQDVIAQLANYRR